MAQVADTELCTEFENEVIRIEPTPKWLRGVVRGETVVDSRRAVLLFEDRHVPAYYFPEADVRADLLKPSDRSTHCPRKGDALYYSIEIGDHVIEDAAWYYPKPSASDPKLDRTPDLRGYLAFYWDKVDRWLEEEEEVFVHARDPYKRVDIARSSRHVRVLVEDTVVADTHRPVLLFETGLPVRYYIPPLDVRMDLLKPSSRVTACARTRARPATTHCRPAASRAGTWPGPTGTRSPAPRASPVPSRSSTSAWISSSTGKSSSGPARAGHRASHKRGLAESRITVPRSGARA